ncbi:MAG TPA: O-antigen ligase family protein, partial [Bacteroidia bacterium]|nr:O-antigen ligase family protein [Bacteroidia bacterium]
QYTLVRYLTSMNLRKDSTGISKLSANDIRAIESGIPNYNFTASSSIEFRLYQALWEVDDYRRGGNVSGHSVTQRLEFWKAAIGIIKQHWLIGVGTGDVRKAFNAQYEAMHSSLTTNFRLRAHNQYLEIGVASGIIGIVWLLFSVIYPGLKTRKIYTYTYFIFWAIFVMSMFSEDTLETQAGVTFYAFFNSFFLFLV